MSADDFTLFDLLNSMESAAFMEFVGENRDKAIMAIVFAHDNDGDGDWNEELEKYRQAVRDGEAPVGTFTVRKSHIKDFFFALAHCYAPHANMGNPVDTTPDPNDPR